MGRTMGRGRAIGQNGSKGVKQGDNRCVGKGVSLGGGQSSDQGGDRGSCATIGLQSDAHTLTSSPLEGSDDESTFHVAPTRRGRASQVQVPEPVNREWIWIEDGEFSNQKACTRIIGTILRALWSGPWESWRNVSTKDKMRLFERFQCYFQWDESWNAEIHKTFEKCIAGKFPDLLGRVRDEAEAMAIYQGFLVEDDMSVLIDFKPPWIRIEIWKQMIEIWNTPEFKAKRERNKSNRSKSTGGIHTLGSQTYVTAKRKAAEAIGRELSHIEMWKQSHCKKGSRPLDKDLSLLVEEVDFEDVDLDENIEEENLDWVDDRARETWVKYKECLVNKYGKEQCKHPKSVDKDLWIQASGGIKKGKVYGLSNVSDSYTHGRQNPEV
ncbi:hypothetical protein QVD17_06165 [Tagetes erecta]|uniref:Transposase n=1 Tax=Tagetes erecta TaxID=13708 RepID=A0AAD8P649_TARER|nr:hypothetical protein QVD17_06165 [Tagetes erecta]